MTVGCGWGCAYQVDTFFTVGLLSTLDAFMDAPLEALLENISLSSQLHNALLLREGEEGKILSIVEHYERAEWNLIDWLYLQERNITPETLSQAYLDALAWVANTMNTMGIQTNK